MVEMGTYTPSEDVYASQTQIPHSLGVVPDFVVVMADEFTVTDDMTLRYISNSSCTRLNLIATNISYSGFNSYITNWPGRTTNWATVENTNYTRFLKESYFIIPFYSADDALKSGITYHYVVGTFE